MSHTGSTLKCYWRSARDRLRKAADERKPDVGESDRTRPRLRSPAMARFETIKVELAGRTWNGSYTLEDGEVSVASAYGSKRVKIGRRAPQRVAEEALRRIGEAARRTIVRPPTAH